MSTEAYRPSCWTWESWAQSDRKGLPTHYCLNLGQERLALGGFLVRIQLIIHETELLATNQPNPGMRPRHQHFACCPNLLESH